MGKDYWTAIGREFGIEGRLGLEAPRETSRGQEPVIRIIVFLLANLNGGNSGGLEMKLYRISRLSGEGLQTHTGPPANLFEPNSGEGHPSEYLVLKRQATQ